MILFLRRALRTPWLLLTLLIMFLISFLGFGYAQLRQNLPCAVCSEDDSAEALELLSYLENYNFVILDSRKEVEQAVADGTADCGVVIVSGLSERMASGSMEGSCEMILSERSLLQTGYSLILCTGLLRGYAPYLTGMALEAKGYSLSMDQIRRYFARAGEEITGLSFIITDVEGSVLPSSPTDLLPVGLIAISAFMFYGFFAVSYVRRRSAPVRIRFASGREYSAFVILPRLLPVGLLMTASTMAGMLAGHALLDYSIPQLLIGTAAYYAALTAVLCLMIQLPLQDYVLICFIALDCALSLVLCPLYQNIALYLPHGGLLRIFSIPYLLYFLRDHTIFALMVLAAALAALLLTAFCAGSKARS